MSPDSILLLTPITHVDVVRLATDSAPVQDVVRALTRACDPPKIVVAAIDSASAVAALADGPPLTAADQRHLMQVGLFRIFHRRNGILPGSAGHHYVKPSGKHSDRFIRTANVLVSGAEVNFIAAALLPLIEKGTERFYCDTAAIAVVAYAVCNLRKMMDAAAPFPVVDSFRSYEGAKIDELVNADTAVFLISSSTSGDLARVLSISRGVRPGRIVTLFSCHDISRDAIGETLCDLLRPPQDLDEERILPIKSYDAERGECDLCRRKSVPVRILGDQFLVGELQVRSIAIRQVDAPPWLAPFMRGNAGRGVVRCYYDHADITNQMEVWLDMDRAGLGKAFEQETDAQKRFLRIVDKGVPATTSVVVHLDDTASVTMAKAIVSHVSRESRGEVQICSAGDVLRAAFSRRREGAVVVTASAIASGRGLMAINQALRGQFPLSALVFVVGVARTRTSAIFKQIQSNLTLSEMYGRYDFHYVDHVCVPDQPHANLSWESETDLWKKMIEAYSEKPDFPRGWIERRLHELGAASSVEVRGLQQNVLLKSPWTEEELRLRPNFAFWPFEYSSDAVTQADVYLTIASVLHSLREREGTDGLRQYEHSRALISPRMFDRFNDGVIQGCLLRAATPAELSYDLRFEDSDVMRQVVQNTFAFAGGQRGEAACEFLVAIATGRLTMLWEHIESALSALAADELVPPVVKYLRQWIRDERQR